MDGATLRQLGLDHWHWCDLNDLYSRTVAIKPTGTEAERRENGVRVVSLMCQAVLLKCHLTLLPV